MRKMSSEANERQPARRGRVLARVLAEDLRRAQGCFGAQNSLATSTVTDLGDRFDVTVRGGDGDAV